MLKEFNDQEIRRFLLSRTASSQEFRQDDKVHVLVKVPFNGDVDYIFHNYEFEKTHGIKTDTSLKYAGFVSYRNENAYDLSYELRRLFLSTEDRSAIVHRMEAAVKAEIIRQVDGKPVQVTDDTELLLREEGDRTEHLNHGARNKATQHFLYRSKPTFEPHIDFHAVSEDKIMSFLHAQDTFAYYEASAFINQYARKLNYQLWANVQTLRELEALERSEGLHHMIRKIAESITDQKKVRLVLQIDGVEMQVKMEAGTLKRHDAWYSTHRLDAQDRREFECVFGRNRSIQPEDILRIEYKNEVLYQRAGG